MFGEKFVASLIDKAIKYPRAATFIVCVLVIGFLGATVKALFIRNSDLTDTANEKLEIRISNCENNSATLQRKVDSLSIAIGDVRAEGLRKEVEWAAKSAADLQQFNKKLESEKAELVRELSSLRKVANQTKNVSEAIKKYSHEN